MESNGTIFILLKYFILRSLLPNSDHLFDFTVKVRINAPDSWK